MTPTLLELALALVVLVVAWQLGMVVAPEILRLFRSLRSEINSAAEQSLQEDPPDQPSPPKP